MKLPQISLKSANIMMMIIGIIIIITIYINYETSMEPFTTKNSFETRFNDAKNTMDSNIEDLNQIKFDFNVKDPIYSYACDLNKKIIAQNDKVLDKDVKNNNISKVEKQIDEIEKVLIKRNIKRDMQNKINTLKSHNNGYDFSIIPVDTYSDKYLVRANEGCIGTSNNNYNIYRCNKDDPSQQFELKRIYNEFAYGKNVGNQDFIEDKHNIEYPFVMAKSVNNNNCITNNHGKVRVMPCNMLKSQRFEPLEKTTNCALTEN
jgi:hypothetical protein